MRIDLNCDMGESFGRWELGEDEALLSVVTSTNIACGFHAGDPLVMQHAVRMAAMCGVSIGAHPGYPDLQGFGRREMCMAPDEIEAFVLYQVGALAAFCRAQGVELIHVKPHGAMYNQAARDARLADSIARAVRRFSPSLIFVGLAGSLLLEAGRTAGLVVASEGFTDRVYEPDGSLRSRHLPGAVLESDAEVCAQAVRLAREGIASRVDGGKMIPVDTLCIHGDHPGAARRASMIRDALVLNGIQIEKL